MLDVRVFGALLLAIAGWTLSDALHWPSPTAGWLSAIVLALVGFVLTPLAIQPALRRITNIVSAASATDVYVASIGAGIGLIFSALVAIPLSMLPRPQSAWLPLIVAAILTYSCARLALLRRIDIAHLIVRPAPVDTAEPDTAAALPSVLLDTSSIIDGRIADISQTGFIAGTLIIPRFVLDELQHIADSSDVLRRNRGRRGLDMLNKLRKESVTPIQILDEDVPDVPEVDGKLVSLARSLHCPIITQDFNLNKVAELQGVTVLNINQLANAVKPLVLPGEEMTVHIIQPGKEINQGVGYQDDGTMIVVEDGQRYINRDIDVVVTRVLQTVAGRMIFAHPKVPSGRERL